MEAFKRIKTLSLLDKNLHFLFVGTATAVTAKMLAANLTLEIRFSAAKSN